MPLTEQPPAGERVRVRIFAPWQKHKEEEWLSALSEKGWQLKEIRGSAGYLFEQRAEKRHYALVYARQTAAPENLDEWSAVARSGSYTYYAGPTAGRPPVAPEEERARLAGLSGHLVTALLINLPGTLFCLFYMTLFFSDGFTWGQLFETTGLWYFLFLLLGLFAIGTFFRWALQARQAARRLVLPE